MVGMALGIALVLPASAIANYSQGMAMFSQNRFAPAASLFFNSISYPKDRKEKRDAEWYLAESLNNLQLFYSASKYYSVIVRRGYSNENPYFRRAMERLGEINRTLSLGQAHIVQLFSKKIDPTAIPGPARGFYFYYLGVERFARKEYEPAASYFQKVPGGSAYRPGALFHLGVIANLNGQFSKAVDYFQDVRTSTPREGIQKDLSEMASLNIARVHYEAKRYERAIKFYGEVPRQSPNWLSAHWEGAWAYFMIQKHNEALGLIHTIHSPFFEHRHFPEAYILQAITFLRLCRYDRVNEALKNFQKRYKPVFADVKSLQQKFRGNPRGYFKVVNSYESKSLDRYRNAFEVLDEVSRSDSYREAIQTIRASNRELDYINGYSANWKTSGLLNELREFLNSKKTAAATDSGRRMLGLTGLYFDSLKDLSDQTGLIQAERMLGKVNELRKKLNITAAKSKIKFIGGLQELPEGATIEYWPFQPNEYWEDELGHYVYNTESLCSRQAEGDQ